TYAGVLRVVIGKDAAAKSLSHVAANSYFPSARMTPPRTRMDGVVRALVWLILPALAATCAPIPVAAQDLVPLFRKVSPSVGVIRAKGRDVTASGQVRFNETGSGVLISTDGKMMTAAHVVGAVDEITHRCLAAQPAPAPA